MSSPEVPLWMRVAAPITAVAVFAGGCTFRASEPHHAQSSAISSEPKLNASPQESLCAVNPTAVTAVDALLAQPENPAVTYRPLPGTTYDASPYTPNAATYLKDQAKKYGQTIVDGSSLANLMALQISTGHTQSFITYSQEVNSFTAKLGFDVQVAKPNDANLLDASRAPTPAELDNNATKQVLEGIVRGYSQVPKAYIALSGLKHVLLVEGTTAGHDAGFALPDGAHDTYVIEINHGFNSGSNAHEVGHLQDAACGFVNHDDAVFDKLNGPAQIYNHDQNNPYDTTHESYDGSYEKDLAALFTKLHVFDLTKYPSLYCAFLTQQAALAHTVLTWSDYHPDDGEDKAEIYSALPYWSNWNVLTDPKLAVLNAKFKLLLERLYMRNPNLVRFLANTSSRPRIDNFAKKFCSK